MTRLNRNWKPAVKALLIALFTAVFTHQSFAANVTLAWDAVTTNEDGSAINDLSGYRLFRSNTSLLGRTTAQAMADASVTKTDVGNVLTTVVTVPPGTYFFRLTAVDTAGNQSAFNVNASNQDVEISTVVPAVDITSPTISAVTTTNIGSSSATVRWTTNEASDSQVEYGLTTAYGNSSAINASMVTSHVLTITGLNPSTQYHFRVKSRDAANNLATGVDSTFTTGAGSNTNDVNGDGTVTVADVQLAVNQALGTATCGAGDVNRDGACNVNDVQRVVNAVLGV